MHPQVVTVGPLASASATQLAASQKAAGAQFLVLNGVGQVGTATNISTAQSYAGAGNVVLNGSLTSGSPAVATLGQNTFIYFTDVGNDSGITATITGTVIAKGVDYKIVGQSETVTLANASIVSSAKQYYTITQIALSGASAGNVSVGTYGTVTLDVARNILFTPAGSDSGITYTIVGGDWNGNPITEVVQGVNNPNTAITALSYLTVSSIKVSGAVNTTMTVGTIASGSPGTNGVASGPWVALDPYASIGPISIQVSGTGTVNWTVQQTLDDPNSVMNPVTPDKVIWVNHADTNLVASAVTTGVQGAYTNTPLWARIVLNSGTGSVKATFIQNFLGG